MRHRNRGGALAVVLTGTAIALAAGLALLAAAAWFAATKVRVTGSASETRIETPFGDVRLRHKEGAPAAAVGLPVYPGATRLEDSRKLASFEIDFGETRKDLRVAVAEYETADPIEKVEEFYRARMDGARISRKHKGRLVIECGRDNARRVAALRTHSDGRVRISLASITEAAAN